MKLIITRPRKDAEALAAKLVALGHEPLQLPLLDIVPRANVEIPALPFQALCLTSANGVLDAAAFPALRQLPVLCVGPQSAAAARAAGYPQVSVQGGDVHGLVRYILSALKPQAGPILYLSGAATSGDLEGQLRSAGFAVTRVVTYDAVATSPPELAAALAAADGVLLYSPRTAALWRSQIEEARLGLHINGVRHYCLSANVAKALPPSWPVRVATTPEESAMLSLLSQEASSQV
jgi:uroporphyrinogen-III synthase